MLKLGDRETETEIKISASHPLHDWFEEAIDSGDLHPASGEALNRWKSAVIWNRQYKRLLQQVKLVGMARLPHLFRDIQSFLESTEEDWGLVVGSGILKLQKYLRYSTFKECTLDDYEQIYLQAGGSAVNGAYAAEFVKNRVDEYKYLFSLYSLIDKKLGPVKSTLDDKQGNRYPYMPDGLPLADWADSMMRPIAAMCRVNPDFDRFIMSRVGGLKDKLGKGGFEDKLRGGIWRLRGGVSSRRQRGTGKALWQLCHAALEALALYNPMLSFYSWNIAETLFPSLFENWNRPNSPIFSDNAYEIEPEHEVMGIEGEYYMKEWGAYKRHPGYSDELLDAIEERPITVVKKALQPDVTIMTNNQLATAMTEMSISDIPLTVPRGKVYRDFY